MKLLLLLACLLLAFGGGYAAQTIYLNQIVSQAYPGVMVNVGKGWVQAQIDSSLQIVTATNPPMLKAVGGGAGVPGPPGPMGQTGPQGAMGPQGIAGVSAPSLPIIVAPDGGIAAKSFQSTGGGPSVIVLTKADGSTCLLTVSAGGAVTCI